MWKIGGQRSEVAPEIEDLIGTPGVAAHPLRESRPFATQCVTATCRFSGCQLFKEGLAKL
jgi:hypothetical protein